MSARSPNSCESSLRYGVSPQPAQAPENSNSGWRSCESLTGVRVRPGRSTPGNSRKKSQLALSVSRSGGCGTMLMAFSRVSLLFFTGHTSKHSAQPVQSSGDTWSVYREFENYFQRAGADWKLCGAPARLSAAYTFSRITACGQTSTHLPHWMQIAGSQAG